MSARESATAADVIGFWRDAGMARWFSRDAAFDKAFRERYLDLHMAAAARDLDAWMESADGTLALLILTDQFPRNAFRGTAHMYATDPLARHFADHAATHGHDAQVDQSLRMFLYLPFMHSEDAADQERSVRLYEAIGGPSLPHALEHRDIIRRFGRFPHRNPLLGRRTTAEEQAFLDQGGFSG